jgi:hypothetical protein
MRGYESAPHHRMRDAARYLQQHRPEIPSDGKERINSSHLTEATRPDDKRARLKTQYDAEHQSVSTTAQEVFDQTVRAIADRGALVARREQYSKNRGDEDAPPSDELAAAAARVSPIYEEIGSVPPAPFNGQPARDWQANVIGELRNKFPGGPHDDIPVRTLLDMDEGGFGQIWSDVTEHAWAAAQAYAPPGVLRARQVLRGGIPVTEYVGDEQAAWRPFMPPARAVRRMRGPGGREIVPNRGFVGPVPW